MDDIAEDVDIQAELEKAGDTPEVVEATPEVTPAPEPTPEPKAEKHVPLAALIEERKRWQQEVNELRETVGKGNERLEKLFQAMQPKQEAPTPPQFEQDPLGHLKYTSETAVQRAEAAAKELESFKNEAMQQKQLQQFYEAVASKEREFAASKPDYMDAAKHVREFKKTELELMGYQGEQLAQALEQNMAAMAAAALRAGKNPAEVAYEYAVRTGFKAPAAQKDIAQLQRGAEAAKTVPSGAGEPSLSLESLAAMNEEDFDRLVEEGNWAKLRGK